LFGERSETKGRYPKSENRIDKGMTAG
jgi:hypothetical protein